MFCCTKSNAAASPLTPPAHSRYASSPQDTCIKREEPEIKAVVLSADANHPLAHTILLALESFKQASLHIHRFPSEGKEPHLEITHKRSPTTEKPNVVFLQETNGPQNTLPVARRIRTLTEKDPIPVIYVSKEKLTSPDPMDGIDEQMMEPQKPSLGAVIEVVKIIEKRFPNAEKQHPLTPFAPPQERRARESAL